MKVLVVTNPFGGHEVGHRITDPEAVASVLAGESAHNVVQSEHEPDETTTKARRRIA